MQILNEKREEKSKEVVLQRQNFEEKLKNITEYQEKQRIEQEMVQVTFDIMVL